MAKIRIEVCMISARGLSRSSSLLKPHWFAVGWIDTNNKYCTKIDTSGSSTPTWRTKFSVLIDENTPSLQVLTLTVEVYRRDPIFLREKLQGTATVMLKEFLVKFVQDRDALGSGIGETGSYQLRKLNSSKPQGFIDIAIHIAEEIEGVNEASRYSDDKNVMNLAIEDGPVVTYPTKPQPSGHQFGAYNESSYPYSHPQQAPINYSNPLPSGPQYRRTPTPPPPPPPSNTGFLPTLFPGASHMPENYVNMPPSGPGGKNSSGPGFGMGLGAGALAAGAVIFGDDFMSGSSFSSSLEDSSLVVSTDPPF